ncbi:MAG: hypothetical protein ABH864_01030 [archaeon]
MRDDKTYNARAQQERAALSFSQLQIATSLGVTMETAARIISTKGRKPYQHSDAGIRGKIARSIGHPVSRMSELGPEDLDGEAKAGRRYFEVRDESGSWYLVGIRGNGSKVLSVRHDDP